MAVTIPFFHTQSSTLVYVVYDVKSKDGVLIDTAVEYEPTTGVASFETLDKV